MTFSFKISRFFLIGITNSCVTFQGNYVADENGSNEPLRKYSEKTLVIVLPGDLTVFDIGEAKTLVSLVVGVCTSALIV